MTENETDKNIPTVLVVDDNQQNLELLLAYLEDVECETASAHDGAEALEIVRQSPPDIIILDVMMPKMSGFEVCRRIKNDPQTTDIPVIMVTALNELGDIERAINSGTDDFLSKPINKWELLTRVRTMLKLKNLTDKLELVFKKIRGHGKLSEKNIKDSMREIRQALLEADVNYSVVKQFCKDVTAAAIGSDVIKSLHPSQVMGERLLSDRLVGQVGIDFQQELPSQNNTGDGAGVGNRHSNTALYALRVGRRHAPAAALPPAVDADAQQLGVDARSTLRRVVQAFQVKNAGAATGYEAGRRRAG